jgi:hypothetical protein
MIKSPRDKATLTVADAHRNGVRLIVHAECLATATLELKLQALAGKPSRSKR